MMLVNYSIGIHRNDISSHEGVGDAYFLVFDEDGRL